MTRRRRVIVVLVVTVSFWIGYSIASTQHSGRVECYERMTWARMDRQWHSHDEWLCFEN